MYRILRAEMVRVNISVKELAMKIGITERSLRNKINGVTDFTITEARKIRPIVSPDMFLDDLFQRNDEVA
jgi:plasmid maintenance system antidote protein VapI